MDSATSNIDMDAIREALMRRRQGGAVPPAASQMTQPVGQTPTGGMPTPVNPPAPAPAIPPAQGGTMPKARGKAEVSVDDETKLVAKVLIQKLMQIL